MNAHQQWRRQSLARHGRGCQHRLHPTMPSMPNQTRPRRLNVWLALLLGLALSLLPLLPAQAQLRAAATPPPSAPVQAGLPLSEQPFYPELEAIRAAWRQHQLGQVVADNPRGTLLNFYAVMAEVIERAERISQAAAREPGWTWSPELSQQIDETTTLFELAVGALDASHFPGSVREDLAQEAALQLKQILDYVFNTSPTPINLPDNSELRRLGAGRGKAVNTWRLPGTAISLNTERNDDPDNIDFFFSPDTVQRISQMYADAKSYPIPKNNFTTPGIYQQFSRTPGFLVPPKWYLKLSPTTRSWLEISYSQQTILQISATFFVAVIGLGLTGLMAFLLIKTYRFRDKGSSRLPTTEDDNIAWLRVLVVLPILPLARFSETVIDDTINLTGLPLELTTYFYFIVYFIAASLLCFLFFEALGRSGAEWLMKLRGSNSQLMLQRMNNLLMPISRSLGVLTALALLYRLLILLGLPPSTVLAFSAVPGLAIGLGASKLLGNLFAGLAIQTDRPLRVGEFCKVGEDTGFITKIGLRSVELQTLESRITIPNSIADETTIVNFSRRSPASESSPMQGLDLTLTIHEEFSPDQIRDLLHYSRQALASEPDLQDVIISIDQPTSDNLTLICFAMVSLHGWIAYLQVRERVLQRLQELIDIVKKSRIVIGVSYDTNQQQLHDIPDLIRSVVEKDSAFSFRSCRLMTINEFSYDFVFDFRSSHTTYSAFKDGISRLNQDLLACFAAHGIEIPYPTQTELQRN
jgi:MscS family membrane protein